MEKLTPEERKKRDNEYRRKWFNDKYKNNEEFRKKKIEQVKAYQQKKKQAK